MLGYIFMGMAFGILYQKAGYNAVWAFFTALFVYAGSMQFMLVELLVRGMGPLYTLLITLSVQCRHMFYGLTFIEDFKKMGKAAPYMVYSLTDETYSLLWSTKAEGHDLKRVRFFIALLDHSYWITGCTLGAALGTLIKFNVTGVDYAMTALFIVIFTEQWLTLKKHRSSALIGLTVGLIFIVVLGVDKFLLPALIISVAALVYKSRKEAAEDA